MAGIGGPSGLPGGSASLPDGAMCDDHPDRPATRRVQGETDSFGCEYHDLCDECWQEWRKAPPMVGRCDWCKTEEQPLHARRDYEEGLHGPVYYVCQPCGRKYAEAVRREAEEYEREHGQWEYD